MASFITYENQTLLWNTMQNVELFFQIIPQDQQTYWFKDIISKIYETNKYKDMNSFELNGLNKYAISFMIKTLKTLQNENRQSITSINREDNTFEMRKEEYDSMLEKKIPAEPNFAEPIEDGVITNMSELIKQHQASRELDIKKEIHWSNEEEIKIIKDKINNITNILEILVSEIKDIRKEVLKKNDIDTTMTSIIKNVEINSLSEES